MARWLYAEFVYRRYDLMIKEADYWWSLLKWPIICLFLIKTQHAHLISIHVLDYACLQIGQAQFILPTVLGLEKIKSSSGNCQFRSPDLATPNNQYVQRATPIIISIRLNKAKRRVNKNTPNMSIANPRTRIQRSGIDALEFMPWCHHCCYFY